MHVQQVAAARTLVEVIDVLGDEEDLAGPRGFEPGQGPMRRVGLDADSSSARRRRL